MTDRFRLTIAQLNPVVGDLAGNAAKAKAAWERGKAAGSDLVALPEMFATGYQPQDLVLKPVFVSEALKAVERLAAETADGPPLAIGGPYATPDGKLHNSYFLLSGGRIAAMTHKYFLPNFNVFDEVRVFSRDRMQGPVDVGGVRWGMPVCEDAWYPDVCEAMAESGAELLLVPNGSPYFRGKFDVRLNVSVARVVETGLPLVYVNMVGGQDDQVFDGGSFVLNPGGEMAVKLPVFEEVVADVDFRRGDDGWSAVAGEVARHPDAWEQDYRTMVVALRDYLAKTGFEKVLLGLSGGIDSALVAAIAADAIGPENVRCVMLPSDYTSRASLDDAAGVATALGCRLDTVPISGAVAAVGEALGPLFEGRAPDLAEENVQSRLRGLLLMALSNKFGEMLLTTGNKSEVAVGYATIYGDMAGGYNPVKDLYKTRVFETARWRNRTHRDWMKGPAGEVIPANVIQKPPSAELRPDQKDEDSLPPYDVLDDILAGLVEREESVSEIVDRGHPRELVRRVEQLLYLSEYKRFQSAPGARLTNHAFWLDRRYPLVNRFRDPT